MEPIPSRPPLSEALCRRFAALALLERLMHDARAFHAGLLEGDDAFLEPTFDFLLGADLVTVGPNDHFRPTALGRRAYERLLHQQQSYLAHFDLFAAVDLGAGAFAEPQTDSLDDPRWCDLRVAVAEFKGVDPYRVVFLSLLAGGRFFEAPGWKFDLALGSSFFVELEQIVQSQIELHELAYEAPDGTTVAADAVLEDVIVQGARINQQRLQEIARRQAAAPDAPQEPADGSEEPVDPDQDEGALFAPPQLYNPTAPAAAYASSARFVEPMWLEPLW